MLEATDLTASITDVKPRIALVGHDLSNDTKYLSKLGFKPTNIAARLDTQSLARQSKVMSPGLKRLLEALAIDAKNLHNAGNDAAYTLQALVSIAVMEHVVPGSVGVAIEEAFRKGKLERNTRKPKTFKEAREMAAAQSAATASTPKPSQNAGGNGQIGLAQYVDPSPTQRVESPVPSSIRRVGDSGSAFGPQLVPGQADQVRISRRGFATATNDGQRHAAGDESRRERKKRLRDERRQGTS